MLLEESVEEIWSRLALFQSRDVLERRYKAHHGGELSAGKADEIIAHLQQARQYFLSAQAAGVLAGPLEQYYGVLAFSRAIVLYRQPPRRSHQTESLLRPNRELGLAKGTPLSVRILFGTPNSLKTLSNTAKAYFSLVVKSASQDSRYRLAKSVMVSG